jgi:hypothetical protein
MTVTVICYVLSVVTMTVTVICYVLSVVTMTVTVICDVVSVVTMNVIVLCDILPCILVDRRQHFGRMQCLSSGCKNEGITYLRNVKSLYQVTDGFVA